MSRSSPHFFTRLPEEFGGKIPFIVTDTIEQLKRMNAVEYEGIFRKNGAARELVDLSRELDNGRIEDWSKYKNVHTIACCLKRYFHDMVPKNPLFPHDLYSKFVEIPNAPDPDVQASKFKQVFSQLSKPRQLTIAYLFKYVLEVEENKVNNKMNAQNLAIVFSPNIICSLNNDPVAALTNNAIQNKFITTLISIGHKIFDDIDTSNAVLTDEDIEVISYPSISKDTIEKYITMRDLRRRSLIPYIPQCGFCDPRFERPTRDVTFENDDKTDFDK